MNNAKQIIEACASVLKLHYVKVDLDETICQAQIEKPTYIEFLAHVLQNEVNGRRRREQQRRMALARLPARHDLDEYDFSYSSGINRQEMKELRQLAWLDQAYNLILMGPSGIGKTFIASGLVYDAVKAGKRAYLMTMEELITIIKMKSISPTAMGNYNRIAKADLLAIDDIMLFPINKEDATGFFNLVNIMHENTSIIITTNKAPTEWARTLDDEIIATALLDRLLYRCEVINLKGNSYRMENRKTIFDKKSKQNNE
ncbi:MAG: IS21-like element helper ATPase IstB [Bacteroidales bacterium]|nr:IS21-like element helper ATPase IstB [Bacteroidales bacterium]